MLQKLVLTVCMTLFSFAEYQKISIGTIDPEYHMRVNNNTLLKILKEVERVYETTLGQNVFDIAQHGGKPVNIVYVPDSDRKTKIEQKTALLERKKIQISNLKALIDIKEKQVKAIGKEVTINKNALNEHISALNDYTKQFQRKKFTSREAYNKAKAYYDEKKEEIERLQKIYYTHYENSYLPHVDEFNQRVARYNALVGEYKFLQIKLEVLSRGFTEKKGVAVGQTRTVYKTVYKDGQYQKTAKTTKTMKKIEIYGFTNLNQLKVILAHEIGHLIGMDHVSIPHALMNPHLQKNQEEYLQLTESDIKEFKRSY